MEIPIPYQAQVNAGNSLLDRFGLSSVQRHQHQVSPAPSPAQPPAPTDHDTHAMPATLTREQAARMTPDERRQWEAAYRSRSYSPSSSPTHAPTLTREQAAAMTHDERRAWEAKYLSR